MSIPKIKAVIEFNGKTYKVVGDISSCVFVKNGVLDQIKTDGFIHRVRFMPNVSNEIKEVFNG